MAYPKALLQDIFREIKHTKARFLSILAIIALGSGFFSGIKTTCPDMKATAADYYERTHLMDIHLMSTFGFTQEDAQAAKQREDVAEVMAAYSTDVLLNEGTEEEAIIKILSYDDNNLNQPELLEGRFPEKSGECVVEQNGFTPSDFALGETITVTSGKEDSPIEDTLVTDTYTIVGIVRNPLYINFQRGSTTLGNGTLNGYMMIGADDFALDVFTDLYLTLESTKGLDPFKDEYSDAVDHAKEDLEQFAKDRAALRYDDILEEATQALNDGKAELAEAEALGQEKLSQAEAELNAAKEELDNGQAELDREKKDALSQIQSGYTQINDGLAQIESKEQELAAQETDLQNFISESEAKLEDGKKKLEEGQFSLNQQRLLFEQLYDENKSKLDKTEQTLNSSQQLINSQKAELETQKQSIADARSKLDQMEQDAINSGTLTEELIAYLAQQRKQLDEQSAVLSQLEQKLNQSQIDLDSQKKLFDQKKAEFLTQTAEAQKKLDDGQAELDQQKANLQSQQALFLSEKEKAEQQISQAKSLLETNKNTLLQNQAELKSQEETANQKFAQAQAELDAGALEYQDGLKSYTEEKASFDKQIADSKQKIKKSEEKLEEINRPEWYLFDRNDNPGYADYGVDAERVDNVAKVFPVFFVLVAILVCLTNMTRMVEEHRTQIGTLKALGYRKFSIIIKYLIYAVLASMIGSIIGVLICSQLFPIVIFNAYRILYIMPDIQTAIRWDYLLWCTLVAIACTSISAFLSCYAELFAQPAQLMRPKSPKAGKRVLLERVPFIWSRLSFIYKVTFRNIFRYKKRVLMTVIGIAGCTALMLTGFGLQNAISSIVPKQFENIFLYDALVAVKDNLTQEEYDELDDFLSENTYIDSHMPVEQKNVDVYSESGSKSAYLFVPQDPEKMDQFISLQERKSQKTLTLEDYGVIINEKLGKLLNVKAGDTLQLSGEDGTLKSVSITAITENYTNNFIYMTPALYEHLNGSQPDYNYFIINTSSPEIKDSLSAQLINHKGVLGLSFADASSQSFKDIVGSLNYIVLVIIISAGALAFVVLYNLVNINVTERTRELATIKVLGFYDNEVSAYVYRENIFCTAIGILLGLILGVFLERFVVQTSEVDMVMFTPEINFGSYLYASVLTLLFTFIVNFVLHFKLKKLDMVESMKSIE